MIVVTGASGITGLAVLRALVRRGTPSAGLRAVVGREGSAVAVRAAGAGEVVVGDLESPATARHALQGAKKLYHICPRMSPGELQIGRLLIAARLDDALQRALKVPAVEKWMGDNGLRPCALSGEAFAAFVRADHAQWVAVVRERDIRPD